MPAPPAAPSATERAAAPPDVGAVSDPEGLVFYGKIRELGDTLATIEGWAGKSFPLAQALGTVIDDDAAPFVDVGAPVDFGVLVSQAGFQLHPRAAVSFALRDPAADGTRLAERFKLVPQANGVSLVQTFGTHPGDRDDDVANLPACEISPAYGPASTRLVCASDAKALDEIGPWLTRTATRSLASADATLNARLQPLRPLLRLGRGLASAYVRAEIDRSLRGMPWVKELVGQTVDDLVDFAIDLDSATIELGTANSELSLSAALKFSGHQSALSRLLSSHPERTAPAPAVFWKLPADANVAYFNRGMDESEIARLRVAFGDAIARSFGKDVPIGESERKLIADVVGKLLVPASVASASGLDDDSVSAAVSALRAIGSKATRQQQADAEAVVEAARFGWHIVSVDAPAADVTSRLKDIGADFDRLATSLAVRSKPLANGVPILLSASLPKGTQWPPSAQHMLLTVPTGDPPAPRILGRGPTLHIVIVPDGEHTWLAAESRVDRLATRLTSTMAGAGPNLGSQPELSAFKTEVGAGGFFVLRLLSGWQASTPVRLPHEGRAPVPFSLTAQPGGDAAVITIRVPQKAIEDMAVGPMRFLP
jgi:hypothetical protein